MIKILLPLATIASLGVGAVAAINVNNNNNTQNRQKTGYQAYPDKSATHYTFDNNKILFQDGKAKYYFYDLDNMSNPNKKWTEANINFTLTKAGTLSMVNAYLANASNGTGGIIMNWLNHNMQDFSALNKLSYIHIIIGTTFPKSWSPNVPVYRVMPDDEAYTDFENNLRQPANTLYNEVKKFKAGQQVDPIAVRFHYSWNMIQDDNFDVSFTPQLPGTIPINAVYGVSMTNKIPGHYLFTVVASGSDINKIWDILKNFKPSSIYYGRGWFAAVNHIIPKLGYYVEKITFGNDSPIQKVMGLAFSTLAKPVFNSSSYQKNGAIIQLDYWAKMPISSQTCTVVDYSPAT